MVPAGISGYGGLLISAPTYPENTQKASSIRAPDDMVVLANSGAAAMPPALMIADRGEQACADGVCV